jgi:hypothetical protein
MTPRARILTVALAISTGAYGVATEAVPQQVTLRYAWTKGETIRHRTTQEITSVISGLPGGMPDVTVTQTMAQVLASTVEDVAADGTATLKQLIESVKIDMNTPDQKMSYDSASPDAATGSGDALMKNMLSGIVGQPYTVVLAAKGSVQKIEGVAALMEKMFKSLPQDPSGAMMRSTMRGMFSEDAMRNMMGQSFAVMPEKPVGIGETWTSETTIKNPMLGDLTTALASTLKSVDGTAATITTKLAIRKSASGPSPTNPMGFTMDIGDSTGEGDLLFDMNKGRVLRTAMRSVMPMTMSGSAPDGTAVNMKTDVTSVVKVEVMEGK